MNDTITPPSTHTDLVRPADDRVVAGVAAALSRRLDVGVGWIRLGFVATAFFGGLGILLYLVGWLVIRDENESTTIAERWIGGLDGASAWLGIALIVVAGMVILSTTDLVRGELVFAAGLFLAGVLLYRGQLPGRIGERFGAPAGAPTSAEAAAEESAIEGDDVTGEGVTPPPVPPAQTALSSPTPPPPPAPPRQPSYLGRLVVAASLILVGTIAVLDNLDVISPGFRHYLAGIVLVVGLGLLAGSVIGRARWLIIIGLLTTPVLFASAAIRVPLSGEWGDQEFRPTTIAEVRDSYGIGGGQLRLDLGELTDVGDGMTVSADVGVGELIVFVPGDASFDIIVDTSVGIGATTLFGSEHGGLGIDDHTEIASSSQTTVSDDRPDLVLDLEVGIGSLQIDATY